MQNDGFFRITMADNLVSGGSRISFGVESTLYFAKFSPKKFDSLKADNVENVIVCLIQVGVSMCCVLWLVIIMDVRSLISVGVQDLCGSDYEWVRVSRSEYVLVGVSVRSQWEWAVWPQQEWVCVSRSEYELRTWVHDHDGRQ